MLQTSQTTNPLVSVIVPIYNAAQWLGEMLDSLQNQEYPSWEAILVDDGSTDDSADICRIRAKGDSRFKIVSKPNGGLSSARNAGLQHAAGQWITFVDADDALQPNAIRRLLETARDTHADIVVGGRDFAVKMGARPMPSLPRVMSPQTAIRQGLYQRRQLNAAWGNIYRREIFIPDGPRFTENTWFEDLDIFYRLFERAKKIAYLPEKLYFYRDNPSSFMNNMSLGRFDVLTVTDRIVEYYRGTPLESAARDRRFSACFNLLLLMSATGYDDPARTQQCLETVRHERLTEIFSPHVRLKNRLGAIASIFGLRFIRFIARRLRHSH